ncbi:UvrD-helicase domain-containing protein [uncultured Methanobrevibacter sp.]|uniref:UvrD-helicase domain-containing protein n=1 Tax=uncultured Methanobrevibacter sp. TaxID=253161 RepID=UPI0025DA0AAA|nr:UvrD-helicase domain-containing protein [uncultured Methanobrevibacter sp.]
MKQVQIYLIETYVAQSAMTNIGVYANDRYLNKDLQEYVGEFFEFTDAIKNPSEIAKMILSIREKMYYNMVDFDDAFSDISDPGENIIRDAILDYEKELKSRNTIDFPMLESLFLEKLDSEKFKSYLDNIKLILVDEYQDTNLLQEKIYFKLARDVIKNGGNITVVGDDDQSLYRFRGATVDLFTNFPIRAKKQLGIDIKEVNLKDNYRSTENIINLCNHFASLDEEYQNARVSHKPPIKCPNTNEEKNIPIIGLFRPSPQLLSRDLAIFISELITKGTVKREVKSIVDTKSFKLINKSEDNDELIKKSKLFDMNKIKDKQYIEISLDKNNGSPNDIAFLTYSPKENTASHKNKFTYYLRKNLQRRKIEVFNPRGKEIHDIESVKIFCGLILECIDPDRKIEKQDKSIPLSAIRYMKKWRESAQKFIDKDPEPNEPISIKSFVEHWQLRRPYNLKKWPNNTRLMDLAYKLITWIDSLQDDIEGLVYLQAICQTITQTGFFNEYGSTIYFDNPTKEQKSIDELYWNIFIPIANGGIKIDEELFETLPNDRLNIMSIHQSKGLEFPMVIVDVGSEYKKDLKRTSYQRYPYKGGGDFELEDRIRKYNNDFEIKNREQLDRSFDDLIRRYFVAFSRAQDVLILIGLDTCIYGYDMEDKHKTIPNIALGWNRNKEFIGFDEIYMI